MTASSIESATRTVWFNGRVLPAHEASISPFDHGLLVGDGVFETLVSYGGRAFAVRRHHARLVRSAAVLGLDVPDEATFREAIAEVLESNRLDHARVRVTVTGGDSPLGSEKGEDAPNVIVAAAETHPWPPTADVVTVPFPRNERGALVGAKTTSYGENVVALAYAKKRGGSEAIFGNLAGNLCEGTGSNVFVVHEGRLITPPLASGCLAGVTRALVIELARDLGIEVAEEDLPLKVFPEVEEAFLTSTTREVQPIARVDARLLGHVPGATATRLAAAFKDLVARDLDP